MAGIGEQWTDCCHVVTVRNVEHVGDQIHVEALAEIDALGYTQVVKDSPGGEAGIAGEVAVEGEQRAVKAGDAWLLKYSGGRCFRIDRVVSL